MAPIAQETVVAPLAEKWSRLPHMKHVWDHILEILEKRLNPGLYKVWIKPLSATWEDGLLTLVAPNDFVASWVRDRLLDAVAEAAAQVLGEQPVITSYSIHYTKLYDAQ